nr:TOBE domain-containing protein [Paracoccaceae bacterium]
VYVTHDQEEALAVSDEIVVMRNAQIAQIGTPRQLYDAPADAFVADFIGEANLIPCEILSIEGDTAQIAVDGYHYNLPSRGLPPGPSKMAVRPSRIVLNAGDGFDATIVKSTYVGVRMEYSIKAAFGSLFAVHEDVQNPLEEGSAVKVSFKDIGPVLIPPD